MKITNVKIKKKSKEKRKSKIVHIKQMLTPISINIEKSKEGKIQELSFSISILWIGFAAVAAYYFILRK